MYNILGCFTDKEDRDLSYKAYYDVTQNSNEKCAIKCKSYGYKFFGTQFG